MDENNSKSINAILEELDISKYSYLFDDNKNLLPYVEEIIVCNKEDVEMFLQMFEIETKIQKIERGKFTMRINEKYLIVYDDFKYLMRDFVRNFLFKVKNNLKEKFFGCNYSSVLSVFDYLKNVLTFVNLILLFSPEFSTMYNLKKQILIEMKNKYYNCEELIHSEFMFVNILNEKFRKCSISWDYRFFLIKYFITTIDKKCFPIEKFFDYNEKILSLFKGLNQISGIFKQTQNIIVFHKNRNDINVLLLDLYLIEKINERDKRNYHLWKYLVNLFNLFYSDLKNNLSELILIFSFCLQNFLKNLLDYSAYSNAINFHKKLKIFLKREELQELKLYLNIVKNYAVDENNLKYLNNLIENYFI